MLLRPWPPPFFVDRKSREDRPWRRRHRRSGANPRRQAQQRPRRRAFRCPERWGLSRAQLDEFSAALFITTSEVALAHGLKPIARVHTAVLAAADRVIMLTAPIPATRKALAGPTPPSSSCYSQMMLSHKAFRMANVSLARAPGSLSATLASERGPRRCRSGPSYVIA